jgi:Mn2+/Fe2+ NRAMP family transporter
MILLLFGLILILLGLSFTIYSFFIIFQGKQSKENDLNVIQRQLRGFAMLIVSNIIIAIGLNVSLKVKN